MAKQAITNLDDVVTTSVNNNAKFGEKMAEINDAKTDVINTADQKKLEIEASGNDAVAQATAKADEANASAQEANDKLIQTTDLRDAVATDRLAVLQAKADTLTAQDQTNIYKNDVVDKYTKIVAIESNVESIEDNVEAINLEVIRNRDRAENATTLVTTKYLGSFDTAPTKDYYNNPINEGALYWDNTTDNLMLFRNNVWVGLDLSSVLQIKNNLADLTDKQAARDVLEVETSNQLNDRDTANRDRANHTGTQDYSTITETDDVKHYVTADKTKVDHITVDNEVDLDNVVDRISTIEDMKDTDVDLAANSDDKYATQKAIKSYVDTQIANTVASEMSYKGGYDADANSPNLDDNPDTGTIAKGDMYTVTVAGVFYSIDVAVGDVLIANVDDADSESDWTIVNRNILEVATEINVDTSGNLTEANVQAELEKIEKGDW